MPQSADPSGAGSHTNRVLNFRLRSMRTTRSSEYWMTPLPIFAFIANPLITTRYEDDDPVDPNPTSDHPRLNLTLIPISPSPPPPDVSLCQPSAFQVVPLTLLCSNSRSQSMTLDNSSVVPVITSAIYSASPTERKLRQHPCKAYLSVRLADAPAIDLVMVASSNGTHMRLLKQSMALVISSLRPIDRVAIVSCTATAMRAFPLRCMNAQGKREALQVVGRFFFIGEVDHAEGLRKGMKLLEDRVHHNLHARILLLSDGPIEPFSCHDVLQFQVQILQFGFGFRSSETCIKHEFEEFLAGLLGEVIRETTLRIGGDKGMMRVWLGDLSEGEERRILVDIDDNGLIPVCYNYVEGVKGLRTGELMVRVDESGETNFVGKMSIGGRSSSVERRENHDPCMARRLAKRLHGLL